ncbi:MAG: primosomal replication protein N [Variovorax sp.]
MPNHLLLGAQVVERGSMRFTPAGVPAIDLQLQHASCLSEAGQPRQVTAVIKAVAFGAVAERIDRQPLGSQWQFGGFLATAQSGRQTVFHIQDFGPV